MQTDTFFFLTEYNWYSKDMESNWLKKNHDEPWDIMLCMLPRPPWLHSDKSLVSRDGS